MSLAKKFGDWTVDEYVPQYTEDEYERLIEFKSNTVLVNALPVTTAIFGALMAWILPGEYSWVSLLIYVPMGLAYVIADQWMKHYAPRPKPILPKKYTALMMMIIVLHGLGVLKNINSIIQVESSVSNMVDGVGIGLLLVSMFFGGWVAMKSMAINRKADQDRFDAETDE